MTFASLGALVISSPSPYLCAYAHDASLLQFHLIRFNHGFHSSVRTALPHTHSVCRAHAPLALNELRSKELNYVHKCMYKVDAMLCDTQHFQQLNVKSEKEGTEKQKHRKYAYLPTCIRIRIRLNSS